MGDGPRQDQGLRLARKALDAAFDALPAQTTVGLVAFNDEFRWLHRPSGLRQSGPALRKAAKQLHASGATRFAEPLAAVTSVLKSAAGPRVLVLLTDGQSSVNPADDEQRCQKLCAELRQAGIDLALFGMGVAYDYDVLNCWAGLAGGGSVLQHVTAGTADLGAMFAQLAQRVAATAAHGVLVSFVPRAGVAVADWTRTRPQVRRVPVLRGGEAVDDSRAAGRDGRQL